MFKNQDKHFTNLFTELLLNDGGSFKNFFRMTKSDFEELLTAVAPKIKKRNSNFRAPISPEVKLAVTLRYIASGDSYTSLMYLFKISKQYISQAVPEVCEAIINVLHGYCEVSNKIIIHIYVCTQFLF